MAEIWLKLSETEVRQGNLSGSVSAITEALAIERSQYIQIYFSQPADSVTIHCRILLQCHVASLSTGCLVAQKNDLLDRRRKFEARISAYEDRISVIMKLNDDTLWSTQIRKRREIDSDGEDTSDNVLARSPNANGWFTPEKESITLLSALTPGEIHRQSLEPIAMIEAELRKGQVTDALEGLHLALGEKSLCF
jgi:hypothetical protein